MRHPQHAATHCTHTAHTLYRTATSFAAKELEDTGSCGSLPHQSMIFRAKRWKKWCLRWLLNKYVCVYTFMYICMCIHTHVCVCRMILRIKEWKTWCLPWRRLTRMSRRDWIKVAIFQCRPMTKVVAKWKVTTHTATHCNTPQHTATHCNTVCSTLQHSVQHTHTVCKREAHWDTLKLCYRQCVAASLLVKDSVLQRLLVQGNDEKLWRNERCLHTLQHTATQCATHCNTVCCRVSQCQWRKLWHNERCLNTLQHTATHCNTLQHTATHCNTLQHTATHCNNTLQQHCNTVCNTRQHSVLQCVAVPMTKNVAQWKVPVYSCIDVYANDELMCLRMMWMKLWRNVFTFIKCIFTYITIANDVNEIVM